MISDRVKKAASFEPPILTQARRSWLEAASFYFRNLTS